MRISFLLGSGVSKPESMLMIGDLDRCIKEGYFEHQIEDKQVVYSRSSSFWSSPHVKRVQRFICELWEVVADLIEELDGRRPSRPTGEESFTMGGGPRETNYEDVGLALSQLVAFAQGSGGAAETALFRSARKSERLVRAATSVYTNLDGAILRKYMNWSKIRDYGKTDLGVQVMVASNEALKLSRFAAASSLVHQKNPSSNNYEPLIEALQEDEVKVTGIITLNHDLILEDLLDAYPPFSHEHGFVDGFGVADKSGIRKYNPDLLYQDHEVPLLIKPHGSISWWRATRTGDDSPVHAVTLEKAKDRLESAPAECIGPVFLKDAGKQEFYSQSIWQEMHRAFRQVLGDTDVLVISGYGFGDTGISEIVFSWIRQNEGKQPVILHRKGSQLIDNIWRFSNNGFFPEYVRQWFCDATLDDVLEAVNAS